MKRLTSAASAVGWGDEQRSGMQGRSDVFVAPGQGTGEGLRQQICLSLNLIVLTAEVDAVMKGLTAVVHVQDAGSAHHLYGTGTRYIQDILWRAKPPHKDSYEHS